MINYQPFFAQLENTPLKDFADELAQIIVLRNDARLHGDYPAWQAVLDHLPAMENVTYQLNSDTIVLSSNTPLKAQENEVLRQSLMRLHPWRKGPYQLFDLFIDTEWRSDWKWQRIAPHISDLTNKTVLDVGCGSGYHCWRMRGAGARFVVGIDPSAKFLFQFAVIKHFMPDEPVHLLPLMSEELPKQMQCFDTVFSMGVLYHRKSPFEHLEELKNALCSGGELILETLVIDGDANTVLVPHDRYAQMRNVWFLPTAIMLEAWLKRLGFINIRTVDINQTSLLEQRSTDWMTFNSLKDFLDPNDVNKTIEGYPAPKRATLIANKP